MYFSLLRLLASSFLIKHCCQLSSGRYLLKTQTPIMLFINCNGVHFTLLLVNPENDSCLVCLHFTIWWPILTCCSGKWKKITSKLLDAHMKKNCETLLYFYGKPLNKHCRVKFKYFIWHVLLYLDCCDLLFKDDHFAYLLLSGKTTTSKTT